MASETSATNTSAMTDKEFVFDLLRRLPDDVTIYEIAQQLEFVAAVRQGLADLDSGRSVSIEQIERDLASWSVTVGRKRRRRQKGTTSETKHTSKSGKTKAGNSSGSSAPPAVSEEADTVTPEIAPPKRNR